MGTLFGQILSDFGNRIKTVGLVGAWAKSDQKGLIRFIRTFVHRTSFLRIFVLNMESIERMF